MTNPPATPAPETECNRTLDIEIPAGEVEREYTRIAQGFQKRAKIPGFRPGKAPLSLVRQHFSGKIREEVLETLVPAHLRAAFERESLEPVSTPTLEGLEFTAGEPLKFKASFEVLPEFELGNYQAIRAEKPTVEVTTAEVDEILAGLRQRHSRLEPSDATEAADGLVAEVEAKLLPKEEATAAGEAEEKPQELGIEVGGAETLPEFSAALRGMKVGEERELEVTYPAEYPNRSFAGKTQKYHLKLTGIQRKIMPDLDDDLVKKVTGNETNTVEELRQRVEKNLRDEKEHEARHKLEETIMEQVLGQTEFALPRSLVEKQLDAKLERSVQSLAERGMDPRKLQVDWSKLRSSQEEAARREVKAALVLEKIAEREKIEASEAAVTEEIERAAVELKQTPEGLRARLTENGVLDRIKNRIRQEQVLKYLIAQATGGVQEGASA